MKGRAPTWSPDGTKVVFESHRGDGRELYAIFVANWDGTHVQQLTPYSANAQPCGRRTAVAGFRGQQSKVIGSPAKA